MHPKIKMHDNLCFSLRRAYLLLFSIYFYARFNSMHSHFNLNYSLVGKLHVVGKDLGTYDQSNIFDHDLLLLTIISMINELGGKILRVFYIRAPSSLAILIHPHALNFCSLFPTPLPETLRTGHKRWMPSGQCFDR